MLYCTALKFTLLNHNILYLSVLYCTVLYCNVLYYIVLYCTVLYCTVLYCTVQTKNRRPRHSLAEARLGHLRRLPSFGGHDQGHHQVLNCVPSVQYCTVLYYTLLYCTVIAVHHCTYSTLSLWKDLSNA